MRFWFPGPDTSTLMLDCLRSTVVSTGRGGRSVSDNDYRAIFETYLQDQIAVLYMPEWPVASLSLTVSAKLMVSKLSHAFLFVTHGCCVCADASSGRNTLLCGNHNRPSDSYRTSWSVSDEVAKLHCSAKGGRTQCDTTITAGKHTVWFPL
jgi:hypothetical protein